MSKISLENKNIIITGSNCGIGYESALDFAKKGANIILACRDATKANKACEDIKYESGNDKVEVELLDLSSLKSTKAFADRILQKWQRLDILVNNAGFAGQAKSLTDESFELMFVTNYLGHYYLTRLLMDLLIKSAPSRIINVSSSAHQMTRMNWDDLQFEKSFSTAKAYGQSKLAQILFTTELAKKLKDTGVSAVSLHPGVVTTQFFTHREGNTCFINCFRCLMPCIICCGKNQQDGAKTTIHCAESANIPEQSGSYYADSRVTSPKSYATDPESATRLWKISAEMVSLSE